jgi:hypothetical protein
MLITSNDDAFAGRRPMKRHDGAERLVLQYPRANA